MRNALLAGLVAVAFTLAGCKDGKSEETKTEASIPVETAAVAVGGIDAAYRGTATLEAKDEATVVAKVGGVVEQVLVEEGQKVKAGEVLARLETDRVQLEVDRTKANLDRVQADFTRNASVYQRNLISREAYERTKFELDAARAAHDLARLSLTESAIRAPFDGTVSVRHIKVGNNIAVGSPAFRITQLETLEAAIFVPERDIHKLAVGQNATLSVDAWPGQAFTGAIARINPVVDANTGTVKVTVAVAGEDARLKPGMFGRVEIVYDRRQSALLVPKDAVINEDEVQTVFVVKDGRARRQTVQTGYTDADNYEVLQGLAAGQVVVTTGQTSLKEDSKVEVVNAGAPEGAPAAAQAAAQ